MWQQKRVSVVFPAYNEAPNITRAVREFQGPGVVDELLVVDNNSTDGTADLARQAGARVVREPRQGYGHALQCGLREATGDLVILAEPDGTFMGKDVLKLLVYADDFQLVMGTRTSSVFIWQGANMGWFLKWGNWAVAKFLQALFNGPALTDMGCTLRLIHRSALKKILPDLTVGSSHFLPEMVTLALLAKIPMVEISVNYCPRVGESKITGQVSRAIRVGFRMISLVLWYRVTRWGLWRLTVRRDRRRRNLGMAGRSAPTGSKRR